MKSPKKEAYLCGSALGQNRFSLSFYSAVSQVLHNNWGVTGPPQSKCSTEAQMRLETWAQHCGLTSHLTSLDQCTLLSLRKMEFPSPNSAFKMLLGECAFPLLVKCYTLSNLNSTSFSVRWSTFHVCMRQWVYLPRALHLDKDGQLKRCQNRNLNLSLNAELFQVLGLYPHIKHIYLVKC